MQLQVALWNLFVSQVRLNKDQNKMWEWGKKQELLPTPESFLNFSKSLWVKQLKGKHKELLHKKCNVKNLRNSYTFYVDLIFDIDCQSTLSNSPLFNPMQHPPGPVES